MVSVCFELLSNIQRRMIHSPHTNMFLSLLFPVSFRGNPSAFAAAAKFSLPLMIRTLSRRCFDKARHFSCGTAGPADGRRFCCFQRQDALDGADSGRPRSGRGSAGRGGGQSARLAAVLRYQLNARLVCMYVLTVRSVAGVVWRGGEGEGAGTADVAVLSAGCCECWVRGDRRWVLSRLCSSAVDGWARKRLSRVSTAPPASVSPTSHFRAKLGAENTALSRQTAFGICERSCHKLRPSSWH